MGGASKPEGPPRAAAGSPPLGAHLSVAGGLWRSVERAVELGCTALQIFTQAPGRWAGPPISGADAERFVGAVRAAGLEGVVFAHAPYLINVASAGERLWGRSVALLTDQLERARLLGLAGLVLHPGAHTGAGVDAGLRRAIDGIGRALEASPGAPPLLIEVTAGQGTVLGSTLEEVASIVKALPGDRVGVCWDTAHLWGAGYDIRSEEGWEKVWVELGSRTGLERPHLIHLNDTNVELGSRKDRHERIGYGTLGVETFARIVRDPRLAATPMVLETPKGGQDDAWDREALELLRCLAAGRGLTALGEAPC
jgi:deoxyribonuclease-4